MPLGSPSGKRPAMVHRTVPFVLRQARSMRSPATFRICSVEGASTSAGLGEQRRRRHATAVRQRQPKVQSATSRSWLLDMMKMTDRHALRQPPAFSRDEVGDFPVDGQARYDDVMDAGWIARWCSRCASGALRTSSSAAERPRDLLASLAAGAEHGRGHLHRCGRGPAHPSLSDRAQGHRRRAGRPPGRLRAVRKPLPTQCRPASASPPSTERLGQPS